LAPRFVALVPLDGCIARANAAARVLAWVVSGFTMTMSGFYWLLEMLRVSAVSDRIVRLFMALLCAYQAGRMALAGWLSARAEQRHWPFGLGIYFGVRSQRVYFSPTFPLYFGATAHAQPCLLQLAEIGGPIAVGLVLVAFNLALSSPFLRECKGGR